MFLDGKGLLLKPVETICKDYENHPIKNLVENGVEVTINTDDLLIFNSSIENEYLLLYKAGTLSADQLEEIRLRGLNGKRKGTVI